MSIPSVIRIGAVRPSFVFSRVLGALLVAALLAAMVAPAPALACACGCGVFDVGTGAMFPNGAGGLFYLEEDFMDQNTNWSGTSQASPDNNGDKEIRTAFYTAGMQYMLNRSWGLSVDVPYWSRRFTTADPDTGEVQTFNHSALGDVRIRGLYTGFSADMSSGVTFGLKLPTGDSRYANFDPDTEIGTGSTDLLLGGYHQGKLTDDGRLSYFVRAQAQLPVLIKSSYHPGEEFVGVVGAYYHGAMSGSMMVVPLLQLTAAYRAHDGGALGDPKDSGYTRLVLAPGVEVDAGKTRVYLEAGFAVYNNMTGNQLVARQLYKLSISYAL